MWLGSVASVRGWFEHVSQGNGRTNGCFNGGPWGVAKVAGDPNHHVRACHGGEVPAKLATQPLGEAGRRGAMANNRVTARDEGVPSHGVWCIHASAASSVLRQCAESAGRDLRSRVTTGIRGRPYWTRKLRTVGKVRRHFRFYPVCMPERSPENWSGRKSFPKGTERSTPVVNSGRRPVVRPVFRARGDAGGAGCSRRWGSWRRLRSGPGPTQASGGGSRRRNLAWWSWVPVC